MSAMQRTKGLAGEREVAGLIREATGWDVRRRVRQHGDDSDLLGVSGWSIEVKRRAAAPRGEIARWWRQAVDQAGTDLPVLFYRADRDSWRAVWPLAASLAPRQTEPWKAYEWTTEGSVQAWAAVARELAVGEP